MEKTNTYFQSVARFRIAHNDFWPLLFALFLGLCTTDSIAKSPVWKITQGIHHLYIGGTIHLLASTDYPLPAAFERAFSGSEKLIFESDAGALAAPAVKARMIAELSLRNGKTLHSVLSPSVFRKLDEFLQKRLIPMASLEQLTPAGASLFLTLNELQRHGIFAEAGVDRYYLTRATRAGKHVDFLETADEQLRFIAGLNRQDGNRVIASTLRDLQNLDATWKDLLAAWRSGDIEALFVLALASMQQEFSDIYQHLLVERNQRWLQQIQPLLATKEVEFLLVGSLHVIGEHGLLDQLRAAGYRVQQLD